MKMQLSQFDIIVLFECLRGSFAISGGDAIFGYDRETRQRTLNKMLTQLQTTEAVAESA